MEPTVEYSDALLAVIANPTDNVKAKVVANNIRFPAFLINLLLLTIEFLPNKYSRRVY